MVKIKNGTFSVHLDKNKKLIERKFKHFQDEEMQNLKINYNPRNLTLMYDPKNKQVKIAIGKITVGKLKNNTKRWDCVSTILTENKESLQIDKTKFCTLDDFLEGQIINRSILVEPTSIQSMLS